VQINQQYTSLLEKVVTQYPEQYFWFHRKWNRSIYEKSQNIS